MLIKTKAFVDTYLKKKTLGIFLFCIDRSQADLLRGHCFNSKLQKSTNVFCQILLYKLTVINDRLFNRKEDIFLGPVNCNNCPLLS